MSIVKESGPVLEMRMNFMVKDPFSTFEFCESTGTEHIRENLDKAFSMLRSGKAAAVFIVPCDARWMYRLCSVPGMSDYCEVRHYTNSATDSWDCEELMTYRKAKAFVKSLDI